MIRSVRIAASPPSCVASGSRSRDARNLHSSAAPPRVHYCFLRALNYTRRDLRYSVAPYGHPTPGAGASTAITRPVRLVRLRPLWGTSRSHRHPTQQTAADHHWTLYERSCARLHEDHLPNMPIQVLESVTVHEAVVFRFLVSCPPGGDRLANHFVDFIPARR